MRLRRLLGGVLLGIAAASGIVCKRSQGPPPSPPPTVVAAEPLVRDQPIYSEYLGQTRGSQEVEGSYAEVRDAQRFLFAAELNLADLRSARLTGVVQLYRALGGGWSLE
jgi:hypothetical protein